ncbi:MAG TPA: transposase, partial [Ktedonobacteraceae bacterium]
PATLLRLVRHGALPWSADVKVVGVDEWAWRKGQRYGTLLVDLEQQKPIDLLADATASSFAAWLQAHPSVEIVSRDRGTTYADGATRGAPQALQIADRWHLIQNLAEALEKVLARHHADLKRAFTAEEQDQLLHPSEPPSLTRIRAVSQAEQARLARQERRRALFARVQELFATSAGLGLPLLVCSAFTGKTAVKYATAEHFPEWRSDRGRKLSPFLPYLRAQWAAGEHNIALLYQTLRTQGYAGSETSVRQYVSSLREEIGPPRRLRR